MLMSDDSEPFITRSAAQLRPDVAEWIIVRAGDRTLLRAENERLTRLVDDLRAVANQLSKRVCRP